ncbi:MAG: sigma 54-interacting transcriptional regulator, partial [Bdellovibrio sp.]|nr:sigma 54-interacting transcriptional regulator [Bdellovibrio sp.]
MKDQSIAQHVTDLATLVKDAGLSSVVCSPHELDLLQNRDLYLVTPGIRFSMQNSGDQKRIMGPKEAMQKGAYDFIEKPIEVERLKVSIRRALENKKLSETIEVITADADFNIENTIIGKTDSMKEIFKKIGSVSDNRVTVLIQGESGTGKELVAKAIHYGGVTKNLPFVAVNCTAITETLLESELFGHVKGAFTGSIKDKKGKFELAGEGTIFLDEISEMSPNLQAKLLRVLQEREFECVGGVETIPMKARIITATNRNLEALVHQNKFREDLYFRLNVVNFEIPPLRDRKEDIPLLVNHFINKINTELHKSVKKVPEEVIVYLQEYNWIGNVRELENLLMQAIVLTKGDVLLKENIFIKKQNDDAQMQNDELLSLDEIEKIHIERVLRRFKWDKTKAAES